MPQIASWTVYTEDFNRQLDLNEHPIAALVRSEIPFTGRRVGMLGENDNKIIFDVLGETIRNDETGEFLAGVVTFRDVTKVTQMIADIRDQDEERFKLICDTMPQLVSLWSQ